MISEELKNDLKIKWDRMRDGMAKMGMDACLLTVDVNLYYTTGQIYSGYFYLPVDGEPWFLIKRPNGLSGHQVEYIRKPEDIPTLFAERGIKMPKRLLLEADELTYNEYIRLQKVFQPEEAGNATAFMRNLRRVKTPWEIGQFRIAARKHEATYSEIPECFRPGMTDLEFQYEIEKRMRKNGSIGLFRAFGANMDIYMGSILAGENAETPSPFDFALGGGGIDASCPLGANGTLLKEGTAIMVDMAGNYTAYMTDMTRVFSVGRLTEEAYRAHQVALTIQQEVENATRPGTSLLQESGQPPAAGNDSARHIIPSHAALCQFAAIGRLFYFCPSCLTIWFTPVAARPDTMPIAIAVSGSFAPYSGIIRIAAIPSTAPEMPQMIGSHLLSSAVAFTVCAIR